MLPIELKNVSKSFGDLRLFSNLNLVIPSGTSLAVTGKSGTGKSTLLHICATLDSPSEGKVLFDGSDVSRMNDLTKSSIRNKGIGFIFQSNLLIEDISVLDNVLMPALIGGKNKKEAIDRALYLLNLLHVGDKKQSRTSVLSGGEKQRIAICRALMNEPEIIMADEPTGALDEENAGQIEDLLLDITKMENRSLLLVTHNTDFANKCKVVLELKNHNLTYLKNE